MNNNEAESILRANFSISYNEYLLLIHIGENIRVSQVFLADGTKLTTGAISKILKSLAGRKMVQIKESNISGRTHVVCLTNAGKKLAAEATKLLENSFISFYENFESKTKIKEFDEQLTNIINKLIEYRTSKN